MTSPLSSKTTTLVVAGYTPLETKRVASIQTDVTNNNSRRVLGVASPLLTLPPPYLQGGLYANIIKYLDLRSTARLSGVSKPILMASTLPMNQLELCKKKELELLSNHSSLRAIKSSDDLNEDYLPEQDVCLSEKSLKDVLESLKFKFEKATSMSAFHEKLVTDDQNLMTVILSEVLKYFRLITENWVKKKSPDWSTQRDFNEMYLKLQRKNAKPLQELMNTYIIRGEEKRLMGALQFCLAEAAKKVPNETSEVKQTLAVVLDVLLHQNNPTLYNPTLSLQTGGNADRMLTVLEVVSDLGIESDYAVEHYTFSSCISLLEKFCEQPNVQKAERMFKLIKQNSQSLSDNLQSELLQRLSLLYLKQKMDEKASGCVLEMLAIKNFKLDKGMEEIISILLERDFKLALKLFEKIKNLFPVDQELNLLFLNDARKICINIIRQFIEFHCKRNEIEQAKELFLFLKVTKALQDPKVFDANLSKAATQIHLVLRKFLISLKDFVLIASAIAKKSNQAYEPLNEFIANTVTPIFELCMETVLKIREPQYKKEWVDSMQDLMDEVTPAYVSLINFIFQNYLMTIKDFQSAIERKTIQADEVARGIACVEVALKGCQEIASSIKEPQYKKEHVDSMKDLMDEMTAAYESIIRDVELSKLL